MAKYTTVPNDNGKVKVRIIEMEVDGSSSALAETLKSVAIALSTRPSNGSNGTKRPAAIASPAADGVDEPVDLAGDEDAGETIEAEAVTKRTRVANAKPPRSPDVLELDFSTATKSLEEFAGEYNLDSDTRKYAAILSWYKDHFATPLVTTDHIHTAFKRLGYKTPRDAGAPLRQLVGKGYQWARNPERGKYEINHIGEGKVAEWKKAG